LSQRMGCTDSKQSIDTSSTNKPVTLIDSKPVPSKLSDSVSVTPEPAVQPVPEDNAVSIPVEEVESPEEIIDNVPEAVSDPVAENEVITEPVPEVIDEVVGCAENHEQDEHEDRHEDDEPSVEPVDEPSVEPVDESPVDESPIEAVDEPKNIVDQSPEDIEISPVVLESSADEEVVETPVEITETVTLVDDSAPPLKQGFIGKEGRLLKTWNNRYFVLDSGSLTYYEKPHNLPPYGINMKGSVPTLKGKKFVPLKDNDLLIKLVGGDARDITLKFPDVDSLKDWTKAINEHIEYYSR